MSGDLVHLVTELAMQIQETNFTQIYKACYCDTNAEKLGHIRDSSVLRTRTVCAEDQTGNNLESQPDLWALKL